MYSSALLGLPTNLGAPSLPRLVWQGWDSTKLRYNFQNFGRLRLVGMLVTAVDLELSAHLAAHFGLGKHALDGFFNDLFGAAVKQAGKRLLAQTAGEAGVPAIEL